MNSAIRSAGIAFAVFIAMSLDSTTATAADKTDKADAAVVAQLTKTFQERFPEAKVESITRSSIAGLYEVYTGDAIVYVEPSGERLLMGPLLDTRTKEDLTARTMSVRNGIDFNSLPFDRAIKIVKGNGKRQLALFSDPDCPYCQALEKELATVTNVTIYTFLYPLQDLHPEAPARAKAIWCSEDRGETWSRWMLQKKQPEAAGTCGGDPVDEMLTLGKKLRIAGTPTMYLADGRRISGSMAANDLETVLTAAQDAAGKATPRSASR